MTSITVVQFDLLALCWSWEVVSVNQPSLHFITLLWQWGDISSLFLLLVKHCQKVKSCWASKIMGNGTQMSLQWFFFFFLIYASKFLEMFILQKLAFCYGIDEVKKKSKCFHLHLEQYCFVLISCKGELHEDWLRQNASTSFWWNGARFV